MIVPQVAVDLLKRLPGVTDVNCQALLAAADSLAVVAQLPLATLERIMGGAKAAKALYEFLNAEMPTSG